MSDQVLEVNDMQVVEPNTTFSTKSEVAESLLDPNHSVLSTGVRVSFKKINPNYLTDITVAVSEGLNLNEDGSVRETDLTTSEQLQLAGKVQTYHNNMIRFGVVLESELPEDDDWLDDIRFMYSDVIDKLKLNPDKKEKDRKFLFLRYEGFQSPSDWQLLSDKITEMNSG